MSGSAELLRRQMAVLSQCAGDGPQPFGALRARLGVAPSTLSRLLRGLVAAELLRPAGGGYVLAPGATRLAVELLGGGRPAGAAQEVVDALARQTGASAACWNLDAGRLILVAKREVDGGFHYIDRFAHRSPGSSVFGIAILAGQPDGMHGTGAMARALARQARRDGLCAGTVPGEADYWRCAAAIRPPGGAACSVGISRHRQPTTGQAGRDRRCVAAAARQLLQRLSA